MKPLVTITTVTKNSEQTLGRTIESVLHQTYNRMEYIIVDGVSEDGTVMLARSYEEAFRQRGFQYQIVSEKDCGMYDAINKGIRMGSGEIVGNINSDDWYELDAVERTVQCFEETGCDFLYADLRMHKKNGSSFIKRAKETKMTTSRNWNHPTQFAKRELLLQEPYKCESLHDDFDLLLRVKKKGYRIAILHEVTANFCMDGMSHDRSLKRAIGRMKARYRVYRNNGYSRLYILECLLVEIGKFIVG